MNSEEKKETELELKVCSKSLKQYLRESLIINSDDEDNEEHKDKEKEKIDKNTAPPFTVNRESLKQCLRKSLILNSEFEESIDIGSDININGKEVENGNPILYETVNEKTKLLGDSDIVESTSSKETRYFTEWQSPIIEWLKPIQEWQRPMVEYQESIREWYVEYGTRIEDGEERSEEEIFQP